MRAEICILLIYLYSPLGIFGDGEKNESVFIPTREWQTVKKGTPIPKGLHVRHNFQTGVTEAKLMDPSETEKKEANESSKHLKSLVLHPDKQLLETENSDSLKIVKESESLKFPIKELKDRLKKLKQDEIASDSNDKNDQTKEGKKFRSYETLKKELKALEINVTNDAEVLTNLFQKFQTYKNGIMSGKLTMLELLEVLGILNDMEYLTHNIDNAQIFTDMEGMTKIISPCLNGTSYEIKAEALRLLGAAAQSNPKVQAKALETDLIKKVLHMLSSNEKIEVKSRCLFALSALIRQFPAAQKAWIDHGGLEIFGKILIDGQLQVQIKAMRLINDLTIERQNLIHDPGHQQKIKEYANTYFEEKLLMHKYCNHLSNLTIKTFNAELTNEFENYDFVEIISESMITVNSLCKFEFVKDRSLLLPIINDLIKFYQNLDNNTRTEDDDVLKNLVSLIEQLRTTLNEITSHDEL